MNASIVTDASGARLVLRGPNGETNAFKISVAESGTAPGLSALAYTAETGAAGAASAMTRTQSAQNAKATINGLDVSSESNTLNNVIDGVTLKLNNDHSALRFSNLERAEQPGQQAGPGDGLGADGDHPEIPVQPPGDEAGPAAEPEGGIAGMAALARRGDGHLAQHAHHQPHDQPGQPVAQQHRRACLGNGDAGSDK